MNCPPRKALIGDFQLYKFRINMRKEPVENGVFDARLGDSAVYFLF
jgi:hypothetical protein